MADDYVIDGVCRTVWRNRANPRVVIEAIVDLKVVLHCPKCKCEVKRSVGKVGRNSKLFCKKECTNQISHLDVLYQEPGCLMKAILLHFGQSNFLDLLKKVPNAKLDKLEELRKTLRKRQSDLAQFIVHEERTPLEIEAEVSPLTENQQNQANPVPPQPLESQENSSMQEKREKSPSKDKRAENANPQRRISPQKIQILQRPRLELPVASPVVVPVNVPKEKSNGNEPDVQAESVRIEDLSKKELIELLKKERKINQEKLLQARTANEDLSNRLAQLEKKFNE